MSVALFQCFDDDTVLKLQSVILASPPQVSFVTRPLCFERCLGILFQGDCNYMYCWCMDLTMNYHGYVAFIGIDAKRNRPVDTYKLSIVDCLPYNYALRSFEEISHFNILVRDFTKVLRTLDFDFESISTVCERCFIGRDTTSMIKCARVIYWFTQNHDMWRTAVDIAKYINGFELEVYSGRFNTMSRCMVHFCMLCLPKFRR